MQKINISIVLLLFSSLFCSPSLASSLIESNNKAHLELTATENEKLDSINEAEHLFQLALLQVRHPRTRQQGIDNLRASLQFRPDCRVVRLLAETLSQAGKHQEAIALTQDLLKLDPANNETRHCHAKILAAHKPSCSKSLEQYAQYLKDNPCDYVVAEEYANAMIALAHKSDALTLLSDLCLKDPGNLSLKCKYAQAQFCCGKTAAAFKIYKEILSIEPAQHEALVGAGHCAFCCGDNLRAETFLRLACATDQIDVNCQLLRAQNFRCMGRLDKASGCLQKCLQQAAHDNEQLLADEKKSEIEFALRVKHIAPVDIAELQVVPTLFKPNSLAQPSY